MLCFKLLLLSYVEPNLDVVFYSVNACLSIELVSSSFFVYINSLFSKFSLYLKKNMLNGH